MSTKNKTKLNGGEFLLKESLSNEIFTPEDFSQEQLMMKDTIIDFMDREIWPDKMKYEEKDYDLTVKAMKKIGELGLLGVSRGKIWWYGYGLYFNNARVDYVSEHQDLWRQHMEHIQVLLYCQFIYLVMKNRSKNIYLNLPQGNGLDHIV